MAGEAAIPVGRDMAHDEDAAIPGDGDGGEPVAPPGLDLPLRPARKPAQAQPQDRPEQRMHPRDKRIIPKRHARSMTRRGTGSDRGASLRRFLQLSSSPVDTTRREAVLSAFP